ncbi:hypothetical protein QE152_g15223 [Popillia japonica]|uniref:Uncharacterized protein n=1 Tax=Popillia japonica TaxID=7064 RepID=A0AAW1L6B8_POPJA
MASLLYLTTSRDRRNPQAFSEVGTCLIELLKLTRNGTPTDRPISYSAKFLLNILLNKADYPSLLALANIPYFTTMNRTQNVQNSLRSNYYGNKISNLPYDEKLQRHLFPL